MSSTPAQTVAEHLAPLGRRRFLLGLGGAAGALGLTASLQACGTPPLDGLTHLTPGQAALFQALAAVFLPGRDSDGLMPYDQLPMLERIDAFYGQFPADVRDLLETAMQMFEWGPYVVGWYWSKFSRLSGPDAIEYCRRWQAGNVVQRGVFAGLRQVTLMPYWTSPQAWPAIGYDGPTSRQAGLPMLGVTPYPGDVP